MKLETLFSNHACVVLALYVEADQNTVFEIVVKPLHTLFDDLSAGLNI